MKYYVFCFVLTLPLVLTILRSLMDMVEKMLPCMFVITCRGSSWKMPLFLLSLRRLSGDHLCKLIVSLQRSVLSMMNFLLEQLHLQQ